MNWHLIRNSFLYSKVWDRLIEVARGAPIMGIDVVEDLKRLKTKFMAASALLDGNKIN